MTAPRISNPGNEGCQKCHGYTVPEVLEDYELGTKVKVEACVNCGARQAWGPVEQMA